MKHDDQWNQFPILQIIDKMGMENEMPLDAKDYDVGYVNGYEQALYMARKHIQKAAMKEMIKWYTAGLDVALDSVGPCECYPDMPDYTSPNCARHRIVPKGTTVNHFIKDNLNLLYADMPEQDIKEYLDDPKNTIE